MAGNKIVAKFAAHNANGWGPYSEPTLDGALIQSIPNKMATPVRDPSTTIEVLVVNWATLEIPDNGYSEIESYNLQWDRGTNGVTWYNLIGYDSDTLVSTFQTVNTLTPGNVYKFKVRAKNFFGWSEFSNVVDIKAATWPEVAEAVTTQIDDLSGGIIVQWL